MMTKKRILIVEDLAITAMDEAQIMRDRGRAARSRWVLK